MKSEMYVVNVVKNNCILVLISAGEALRMNVCMHVFMCVQKT